MRALGGGWFMESNFARLEAEGLIVPDYKFTEEDRQAIASLHPDEVEAIIRTVKKLVPNWNPSFARKYKNAPRGIIL